MKHLEHVCKSNCTCEYAPWVECLAVFIATLLTICGNLSATTSGKTDQEGGDSFTKCFSAGLAVMIALYIAGGISGAHLNPIFTFVIKVIEKRPGWTWKRCFVYVLVQFVGSFAGGAIAIGIYFQSIKHMDLNEGCTKALSHDNIGSAIYLVPHDFLHPCSSIVNDGLASAILIITILALRDKNNNPPKANTLPLIAGLAVTCLAMSLGYNTGGASNPLRDFGPRLAACAWFKDGTMWANQGWWLWGAWMAPICGGALGAYTYKVLIKPISDKKGEEQDEPTEKIRTSSVNAAEAGLAPHQPSMEMRGASSGNVDEAGHVPVQHEAERPQRREL